MFKSVAKVTKLGKCCSREIQSTAGQVFFCIDLGLVILTAVDESRQISFRHHQSLGEPQFPTPFVLNQSLFHQKHCSFHKEWYTDWSLNMSTEK